MQYAAIIKTDNLANLLKLIISALAVVQSYVTNIYCLKIYTIL